MEADHRPTSHHDDTLLCHIRTVHRESYRGSRVSLIYGVHRPWTRHDVDYYELVFTCGIVFLYGKIPENHRRDTRLTDSISCYHIRIPLGRCHTRTHHGWYRPLGSIILHTSNICSYWRDARICIPHFTPIFTRRTPQWYSRG